jgi:hypothetical protein
MLDLATASNHPLPAASAGLRNAALRTNPWCAAEGELVAPVAGTIIGSAPQGNVTRR